MGKIEKNIYYEQDGKKYEVDTDTGEITEMVTIDVPVGSTVRTPKQRKTYEEYLKAQQFKAARKAANSELGDFFFILKECELGKISAISSGRLIYLLTYIGFDGTLMLSQRNPMRKMDLVDVMNLPERTVKRFWNEICPDYIQETDGVLKVINPDIVRGALKNKHDVYQKLYIQAIRSLYSKVEASNHKHLGYVFQALRYINIEYNVLCSNPYETDIALITPISIGEFCEIIGFDASNFHRLRKIYNAITFEVDGQEQYFLIFVSNKNNANDIRMFVNPRILYSGSNYRNVEVLELFTKRK